MKLENNCSLKVPLMSAEPIHYRPSLIDEDVTDLNAIFDQFIEPYAFMNYNQLPPDFDYNILYKEAGDWLGMNVNADVTVSPMFDEPIYPKASLLSSYDTATTSAEVVNGFDNDWFDSLWTSPSATGSPMQNTMEIMEETQTFAPSRRTTRNLSLRARGRAQSTPESSSSRNSTPPLNSGPRALSSANPNSTNKEDTTNPFFRCPSFRCTSRFMSPEEASAHVGHHLYSKKFRCPHLDCKYTSIRINDVRRHCETASHGKPASFFCRGCRQRFTRKDATKRHQSQSSKDPRCVAFRGSNAGIGVVGECAG